jgi:hypothetical protein
MAALTNTITSADIAFAQDAVFNERFDNSMSALTDVIGILGVETLAAGSALYQYKITGELGDGQGAEGDIVPLSKYKQTKTSIGDLVANFYSTETTAQAILAHGVENAVDRVDAKMVQQLRAKIMTDFFTLLQTGTGTATGSTLQAALATADAALDVALDNNDDASANRVYFINPVDRGTWLADHEITGNQTAFGMTYIQGFLGLNGTALFSAKVPQGKVIVTPAENIHMYAPDYSALAAGGMAYTVSDSGLIGVNHESDYSRASVRTNAVCGLKVVPEVLDYIVIASIATASK